MYVDARELPADVTLEADICIVGAGPAGLALASRLIDHGLHVLLLESGGEQPDGAVLALNHGETLGDPYAGLAATRHRRIGGTTAIWNTTVRGEVGAKYVPLEPVDFLRRPTTAPGAWPIQHEELRPYYAGAAELCGLDTADDDERPPVAPCPAEPLVQRLYYLGSRRRLVDPLLEKLRASDSRLCHHATVLSVDADAGGAEATRLTFSTLDGRIRTARAPRFVLAAGAVENARLLLLSATRAEEFGNEGDWVGRCFMEHPRDSSISFRPPSSSFYAGAAVYDVHDGPLGGPRLGRLGLQESTIVSEELPNASGTLLPIVRPSVRGIRAGLGPLATRPHVARLLPPGGHGWSAHPAPALVYERFMILLNIEQPPRPENRVRLADDRDSLGMPRAELHWRLHPDDRAAIRRLRRVVADALRSSGFGDVELDERAEIDPNAHHHAGTTRMARHPDEGVVDANLRVFGMENLFVTGASVFPTAGFANPLLSILALSLRLADHLGQRRGPTGASHDP